MTPTLFSRMAALLAAAFLLASCKTNDSASTMPTPVSTTIPLIATLTGAQVRPTPTPSAATGTFGGTIDRTTRVLSYTLAFSGLTATEGHLHRLDPQKTDGTGPAVTTFSGLASPFSGTTGPLAQSRIDSIVNGLFYVDIHTTTYPNGEIRGNVQVK